MERERERGDRGVSRADEVLGGVSIRCCAMVSACKGDNRESEGEKKVGVRVKGEVRTDKGTKRLEKTKVL